MTPALTVTEATSFEEAEAFRSGWDRLASLRRWPFAEFAWLRDIGTHVAVDRGVTIYLVCRDDALVAAIALSGTPRTSFELVGSTAFYEASPLLSVDADATARLIDHLVGRRTPIALARVLEPDEIDPHLTAATAGKGITITRTPPAAPYLRLPKTPGAFVSSLSSNRRSMLSRKRRKLAVDGALEFRSTYPNAEQVAIDLAEFEQIESAGWKGKQGSAVTARAGFHEFFTAALGREAARSRVRIDRLTLNGETIAVQFGLVCYGRYFLIKPTFDERLAKLSPGQHLTYDAIQQSIRDGLETYEFLGADEQWKLLWADRLRPTRTWIHYPSNARGLLRFGADAARAVARKL